MICKSFKALTPLEKSIMIGKIVHAVQSSEHCFNLSKEIIESAERRGYFKGVTIMPESQNLDNGE